MGFPYHLRRRPRAPETLLAVVARDGDRVRLRCPACGLDRGWVAGLTATEQRRQPCPRCGGADRASEGFRARPTRA
jgi:hypothetical protein